MNNIIETMVEKLEAAGYQTKVWGGRNEDRIYVTQNGKDLGYVTEYDADGGTGTCKNVKRGGSIAAALRG